MLVVRRFFVWRWRAVMFQLPSFRQTSNDIGSGEASIITHIVVSRISDFAVISIIYLQCTSNDTCFACIGLCRL